MSVKVLGVLLALASLRVDANPILPTKGEANQRLDFVRLKRQFNPPGFLNFGNNGFSENAIFFDNDNMFNDFVQTQPRGRTSRQSSTPRPGGFTTIAIPGMGTTRSACEDRCITTPQYDPVCGDNNVTYMNMARFRCAVNCGKNVQIVAYRACPRF